MADLRESVARAICIADGRDPDEWFAIDGVPTLWGWERYIKHADAAIKLIVEECAKVAARQIGDWSYITPSARAWHVENVAAAIRALATKEDKV